MIGDGPSAPPPGVDPAVDLERLHGPAAYPPGFYGSMRRRLPWFALVGSLSVLLGLIPFPHERTGEVLIAGCLFFVLTVTAWLLPWPRVPQWFWPVIPIGYVAVIALIAGAQGGASSGLTALYFLPIVWLAFYGRRSQVLVGLAAVALALVIPMVVVGPPEYPASGWRAVLVTLIVATLTAFTFLAMVARDRAYVADLAEQSHFAQQSARAAVEAREQLDSLLRAATETAILGIDADGVVGFFSAGAERLLGYRAAEVVGVKSVYEFIDPPEVAGQPGRRGPAGGLGTATGEKSVWTYIRRDGARRRATVAVTSRTDADGRIGYVVVASDVTEREQLAEERERLLSVQREVTEVLVEQNHRLRELTQMKDDVVATVSHELRTPLTSIRGFVELLLDGEASFDPEQVRMLRTIDRNSDQLLRVAEDLLADPGGHGLRVHFVETDLAEVAVEDVDSMAALADDRRIDLSVTTDGPVLVHGDPSRLHQLFANLLSNAVKFTPVGGRVLVRVDHFSHFARIEVLDDGPGIPDSERPQLFERFYRLASTTKQGIPGTGLGLAIAKAVVEAHDGTIDIVDTPGWATTFRVLLPMAEPRSDALGGAIPA